jgi:hypothetical protein
MLFVLASGNQIIKSTVGLRVYLITMMFSFSGVIQKASFKGTSDLEEPKTQVQNSIFKLVQD